MAIISLKFQYFLLRILKIFFILIFFLSYDSTFSQNQKQTENWILNNADNHEGYNFQIFYSSSKNLIYFMSKFTDNNHYTWIDVRSLNPKMVSSINTDFDDGFYDIDLTLKENTYVNYANGDVGRGYGTLYNLSQTMNLDYKYSNTYRKISPFFGYKSKSKSDKVKNALIHYFKSIGHNVVDEDNMF